MKLMIILPRLFYAMISIILVGIALLLVLYALKEVAIAMQFDGGRTIDELLNAIGIVVISTALIDVAKFLAEEEVFSTRRSLPSANEIRRSLTKFLSIITIAVCMEALVFVFKAGKTGSMALIYPTLLLFAGIAAVIGLGVFLRVTPHETAPLESLLRQNNNVSPLVQPSESGHKGAAHDKRVVKRAHHGNGKTIRHVS